MNWSVNLNRLGSRDPHGEELLWAITPPLIWSIPTISGRFPIEEHFLSHPARAAGARSPAKGSCACDHRPVRGLCAWAMPAHSSVLHEQRSCFSGERTFGCTRCFFPALLAVVLASAKARESFRKWIHPITALTAFALLYVVFHKFGPDASIRLIVIPICFPLIVASTMLAPQSAMRRVLEFGPLRLIGRLCF